MIADPDHDSIFGTTICGVPSPLTPVQHPYPTRYHGAWFGTISQNSTYRENPYQVPVDAGPGLNGCGPCGAGFYVSAGDEPNVPRRVLISALIGTAIGFGAATIQEKVGKQRLKTALLTGGVAIGFDMLINRKVYFGE